MNSQSIWNIWEYAIDIFDCALAIFLFHSMLLPKYKSKWIPISFCIVSSSLLFLINHIMVSLISAFLFALVFVAYNCMIMDGQIGSKIFWPFYCVIIFDVIDSISSTLWHFFGVPLSLNIGASLVPVASKERLVDMVISRILIAAVIILTSRKKRFPIHLNLFTWLILCGILFCSGISISILLDYIYQNNIKSFALFFVVFSILLVGILAFAILNIFSKQAAEIIRLQVKSAHAEMARKQGELAISAYNSLRKWKHDFHNHIETINQMAIQGEDAEIKKYTDSISSHFDSDCLLVVTGNSFIDAILNSKLYIAKAEQISIKLNLEVPDLGQIDGYDISSLIGNMLDNAIEANQKIKNPLKRYINFKIHFSSPFCIIHCSNALSELPKIEKEHLISSKSGNGHGLGFTQIKDITKKYDGIYQYNYDLDTFNLDVMLPVNPVQSSLHMFSYSQKEESL